MPQAFLTLLLFQLLGTLLQNALHLPVPGPVIGMFLLAAALLWRQKRTSRAAPDDEAATSIPGPLSALAQALIACLGLLFVPAGVGLVSEIRVLSENAFPIVVALCGSTLLGLVVTASVMHLLTRDRVAPDQVPGDGGQVL